MFKFWSGGAKASGSFYRNAFAIASFAVFIVALLTDSPVCFLAALMFGGLSRTAVKKGWKNPEFAEKSGFLIRKD